MYRRNKIKFNSAGLAAILVLFLTGTTVMAQEYWQVTGGPYGGPINCVVYNSKDEAFAFSNWNGLFYSNNHGDSWERRNGLIATDVIVDTNDVLIANESYTANIYRSTDGGITWTMYTNVINAGQVIALAVNSQNILFAGTSDNGMFSSENGGANWTEINTNLTYKTVNTISTYGARIYIGTSGGKVFRSADNGDNWESVGTGISETNVYSILHITGGTILAGTSGSIYLSVNNGDSWSPVATGLSVIYNFAKFNDSVIYASTYDGVYISFNGGQSWSRVTNGLSNTCVMSIAVCSHNIALAGTYFGFYDGIYRSMDSGANWTQVNYGLRGVRIWKMIVAPNGIIYAGSFTSGMFRSVDNGNTWEPIDNGLIGFTQSERIKGLAANLDNWIFIGTQGGGMFRSTNNGLNWNRINTGLPETYITSVAYFPYPGEVYAGTANNGVYKSSDNGNNWNHTGAQLDTVSVADFKMAPNNTIFAGTSYYKGIFRSTNFGTDWTQVGTGDLATANVYAVAINSMGYIYAATYGKGIFKSTDNGNTWVHLSQGLQNNTNFRSLAINRLDHVFAGSDMVFVSKNDGDNWDDITSNIIGSEINTFALNDEGYLFAGNSHGVFRSIKSTTEVRVKFSVKMLYANGFNPSTDTVVVRGNFNNWGSTGDNVYFDPVISDPDITFTGSFTTNSPDTLAGWITDDTLRYKFLFKNAGGNNGEAHIANRTVFWDQLSDLNLPAVWFDEPANNPQDSTALAALFNNTLGNNWTNKDNWQTDRPFAHWYGVTADANGRVITLRLGNNNLTGAIPAEINLLQAMRELSLYLNNLDDIIPVQIGQLQNLSSLSFYNNDLTGNIPSGIGNLNKLVYLDLGYNDLTGAIPSSLGNLADLEDLRLGSNQLTGSVPPQIWGLTNLKMLWLAYNQLDGTLPSSLGNLSQLTHLYLGHNQFSGSIPNEIGNLTNLIFLELYDNLMIGSIPATISNLTNLEYLRLYNNKLNGPVPAGIGSLNKVKEISLQVNQFSGAVPSAITGIDSLYELYLQSNKFKDLPDLTSMTRLNQLKVQNNQLTFEDLEPNITIPNFIYSPQDSVGIAYDTSVTQYSSLTLNVFVDGNNNHYQWYQSGAAISGATSNSYNINSVGAADQGSYICTITNTVATALTLYSRPITVIVPGVAPPAPLLSAPLDGTAGIPLNPTLIWNAAAGAESYQLQVNKNNAFTPPLAYDSSGIVATTQQVTGLTGNTVYYWRVRASNGTGTGDWSARWSFTTASGTLPNPPALTTPLNDATGVSIFPTLQWTAVTGTYQVQIDTNITLNSPFVDIDTLTQQKFTIRDRGLQFNNPYYWRVAVTAGGTKSNWSEVRGFTTEIYPSDIQLLNTTDFPTKSNPGEFKSTDYKIYGIPGNDSAPLGDLGGQAGVNWQAYWDNGKNGKLSDYLVKFDNSGTFNCITGRAFWLVSNGAVNVNMSALTAPLNSDQQAEIDVHPGWNLITDPFLFAVSWDFVKQANSITVPLWSFTGNVGGLWVQSNSLQPYVGYYFDNVTSLSKLKIPYKRAISKPMAPQVKQWQLTVSIESAGLKESSTQLGMADDALAGWDQYDYRKPRAVGALPGVYFYRPEWDEGYGVFATDFRPPFDKLERWSLTVTATAGQKVLLTVTGVEEIPAGQGVFLLDKEHLCPVDLRQQDGYSFIAALPENEFEIMVGNREEIEQELRTIVPRDLTLGKNFPNPFNPQTTIPVTLPADTRIVLKIYNLLGQEIKILYAGILMTGKHYFFWDGGDQSGKKVPSGIYLYRLSTDKGTNLTGKMVMVK